MAYTVDNLNEEILEKMEERVSFYQKTLDNIRTGTASPSLVQDIMVEAYGSKMKLRDLASINTPEPRLLAIQPYDQTTIPSIEKGIMMSDLGITPMSDGQVIRLPLPELTEERRKELVKMLKAKGEDTKVEIRNLRRDGNDFAKKAQKNGEMTEDDLKLTLDDIQTDTDKQIKAISDLASAKEEEIMTV